MSSMRAQWACACVVWIALGYWSSSTRAQVAPTADAPPAATATEASPTDDAATASDALPPDVAPPAATASDALPPDDATLVATAAPSDPRAVVASEPAVSVPIVAPPVVAPAAESNPEAELPRERERTISLTFAPLLLGSPVVELTIEVALGNQLGVALIGGIGAATVQLGDKETSAAAYELGGSFRYYLTGNFDNGVQVGAELLWVNVAANAKTSSAGITATVDGLSVGPFVGYKLTSSIGLTFEGQVGMAYLSARSNAADADDSQRGSLSTLALLLNLNVGFSF